MNEAELSGTWSVHAYREDGRRGIYYSTIGPKPWVALHGLSAPIVPVAVTEVGADDPEATHWGWIDAGSDTPAWALVWPSRAQYEVCFPYGVLLEEERGKGRTVRLRVEGSREDSNA